MGLREQNIEKRRQRILTAARQIISAQGPEELSMRALAKRAQLSVTTLYNLFGTKEEIMMALMQEGVKSVRPLLELAAASDPLLALRQLTTTPSRYLIENASIIRPMITTGIHQNAGRTPVSQAFFGTIVAILEKLIRSAQDADFLEKRIDARVLAAEIFFGLRVAVEDWGVGFISDEALARRFETATKHVLLSAAKDSAREQLIRDLEKLTEATHRDLASLFPGLGGAAESRQAEKTPHSLRSNTR